MFGIAKHLKGTIMSEKSDDDRVEAINGDQLEIVYRYLAGAGGAGRAPIAFAAWLDQKSAKEGVTNGQQALKNSLGESYDQVLKAYK